MQIGPTQLNIFDPSESLPNLAKALLLVQRAINVTHPPRKDRLCSIRLVRVTSAYSSAPTILGPIASDFRDMSMRWAVLRTNDRIDVLKGL